MKCEICGNDYAEMLTHFKIFDTILCESHWSEFNRNNTYISICREWRIIFNELSIQEHLMCHPHSNPKEFIDPIRILQKSLIDLEHKIYVDLQNEIKEMKEAWLLKHNLKDIKIDKFAK